VTGNSAVRLALAGLIALAIAMGVGRFAYTPILPYMLAGAGLSLQGSGYLASANFAGYLIGALAASTPLFRSRRALWIIGALTTSAITTAAMGFVSAYPAWLALRFISGVVSALAFVLSSGLVLDGLARHGRAGLSALLYAGVGSGIAFSALAVDATLRLGGDVGQVWAYAWLVLGLASALALIAPAWIFFTEDSGRPQSGTRAVQPAADVRADHAAWAWRGPLVRLIAAYGLFGFGYVVTATFVVAMARSGNYPAGTETLVWLAVGLAAAPSVVIWNRVAEGIGLARAFVAGLLVEAAGVAATALATGAMALIIGAALLGATFVSITALGLMRARALAPLSSQRAVGLMTAAFAFGQMVGPSIAATIASQTGDFRMASILAAGALVVAALIAPRKINA
jgi:MFS family permease